MPRRFEPPAASVARPAVTNEEPFVDVAPRKRGRDPTPAPLPAKTGPIVFGLGKQAVAGPDAPPTKVAPAFKASHLIALGSDYEQLHRLAIDNKPVVKHCPKLGKWLCLISRRQFNSEDQLKRHVAKSQLYKTSLDKAAHSKRLVLRPPS